ncbi:hypothetical protein ACQRET_03600 [Streptomyces koyangensis]|uniref:hypothetical protein n=1 Tax=Streptomyces koyangensis TaxID=188770 RepID=UPI003D061B34
MTTVYLLAALLAGYGLGRWQPYTRLGDWVAWEVHLHIDRWTTRPRQLVLAALLLITDPRRTLRAWRHRHDPPPPRSPAMQVPPPYRPEGEEAR